MDRMENQDLNDSPLLSSPLLVSYSDGLASHAIAYKATQLDGEKLKETSSTIPTCSVQISEKFLNFIFLDR